MNLKLLAAVSMCGVAGVAAVSFAVSAPETQHLHLDVEVPATYGAAPELTALPEIPPEEPAIILAANAVLPGPDEADLWQALLDRSATPEPEIAAIVPMGPDGLRTGADAPPDLAAGRLEMAQLGKDDFDVLTLYPLPSEPVREKRENVEILQADLPGQGDLGAMSADATGEPEAAIADAEESEPVDVASVQNEAFEFDPFGSFAFAADPASSLVSAFAEERSALEGPGIAVEDTEYVEPFAEEDAAARGVVSAKGLDLSVLAQMSPEQIEASIALVAALNDPQVASSYLQQRRQPVRNLAPAPVMSGIPGLNDSLELPAVGEEPENLLTRGWQAIDTYGVVTLRKDGDASTELVVEPGMVLGAWGTILDVRRTQTELIVETAKAGIIKGVPDHRPRPRPVWLDNPN